MTDGDKELLRPPDYDMIQLKDPMSFIDMLGFMIFLEGHMNPETAKMPVGRTRTIFKEWLRRHDAALQSHQPGGEGDKHE